MRKPPKNQIAGERIERNSLTREKILAAAYSQVKRTGSIPSIRVLAAGLGSSPMAIYTHFPNKDALLLQMLDQVLGEVPLTQSKKSVRSQIIDFSYAHRNVLIAHPWAIPHFFSNPSTGKNSIQIGEHVFDLLMRGGIKGEEAVALFSGIIALNYGWASFVINKPEEFDEVFSDQLAAQSAEVDVKYPRTAALAPDIKNFGSDRHYDLVLKQMLSNI